MKKILFLMMTCMGLTFQSYAQSTDVSTYDNVIYLENAVGEPGTQILLSLQMNNTVEARGFQCDVYLPKGLSFALSTSGNPIARLSLDRTTATKTDFFQAVIQADGCLRVLCNSMSGNSFEGNSGEVALIAVDVDASMAKGDYTMYVKNTKISDPQAQDHKVDEAINSTFTVGTPTYDAGCAVQILPFAFTEDLTGLPFVLTAPEKLTSIDFDIVLPDMMGQNQIYGITGGVSTVTAVTTTTDDGYGNINVSIVQKSSTKTISSGAKLAYLELGFDSEICTPSVETILIRHIRFKDKNGKTYKVAPYAADIFVGSNPKAAITDKTVAFHGNFSGEDEMALLNAALPADGYDVMNMKDVTAVSTETPIAPANANVLYLNPKGITLANDNSIVNDTCAQFTLTDGHDYNAPFAFTATNAQYTRNFKNHNWQALYLPFEVEVADIAEDFDVAVMNGTASTSETIVIEKLTEGILAANTPYFIRLKAAKDTQDYTFEATNQDIAVTAAGATTYGDYTLTGIYAAINGTEMIEKSAMALSGNNFCEALDASAKLNAFRFYLTGASQEVKVVVDGETGIEDVDVDVDVDEIYNLAGQKMQKAQKGVNIVNGKKVIF